MQQKLQILASGSENNYIIRVALELDTRQRVGHF